HVSLLIFSSFFFYAYGATRDLHSFPTRRSSDLYRKVPVNRDDIGATALSVEPEMEQVFVACPDHISNPDDFERKLFVLRNYASQDRKSTRLNSSHDQISYAVFCLKKKKKKIRSVTFRRIIRKKYKTTSTIRRQKNIQLGRYQSCRFFDRRISTNTILFTLYNAIIL